MQLGYVTKELPKGGFQCTLFLPEIGYIHGEVGRGKSEAEHSAAYKALQKLKQASKVDANEKAASILITNFTSKKGRFESVVIHILNPCL